MKKERTAEESKPTQLTVTLPSHIVRDLETMTKNTKRPMDDLVKTSLLMFIATHNDFLGRNRTNQ